MNRFITPPQAPISRSWPEIHPADRALRMAPAHMGQGSRVTYRVQPSSRQVPRGPVGLGHGLHLRMGPGGLALLPAVAAPADDPAVPDDDAAHRHLAAGGGLPGQVRAWRIYSSCILRTSRKFLLVPGLKPVISVQNNRTNRLQACARRDHHGKKKKSGRSPTLEELRQELHQTNQALRNAYDKFNFVTAPELVEASIYEINALKARSDYLLRCIKAQLGQEPCAAAAAMKGGTACPS